jgi:signal transduction histidine kinase/CheY-like chemotaxis protein/tetratricopeptide (TPR) repeat protein
MKLLAFICLLWFLPVLLHCQVADPVLDSLKRPLPKAATGRQQAQRLRSILWHIFRSEEVPYAQFPAQLDSLFRCCLAGKTGDLRFEKKLEAEIHFFKGAAVVYDDPKGAQRLLETAIHQFGALKDSSSMALGNLELCFVASGLGDSLMFAKIRTEATRLSGHLQEPFLKGMFLNNLGITCYDFGEYAAAAAYYFEALALIEKYPTREMLDAQRDVYHNLGGVYNRLGDNENALLYAQKGIESAIATGQDPSDHYAQLSWIYMDKKDYRRALEALLVITNSKNTAASVNRTAEKTYGLANCYLHLGEVEKALPLAREGVRRLPVSSSVHYGGAALEVLARCEFASGMTPLALEHAHTAYDAFVQGKNKRGSASSAELLMQIYQSKGDYVKALEYSEARYRHMEQIERQQSTRQLAFGEFTRESEVKTARREAEVQAQLTRQRNIRYALFAGLGVLALLAFLLYNRYRFKQRTNEQLEAKNLEVEAAKERAERSEAFKSRFLANMSHEIRTPLHGIAGFTDLVLETSLSEKQRRYLSSIHHSTERLTEVVNDILDISKLEAGEVKLRQAPFSPARIARDVQEALSVRAENKGIELSVHIGDGVPEAVLGDPTRLYQILMNLAGNAVKFTEKGDVRLTVDGGRETVDGSHAYALTSLTFSLADTGIGIPAEKLSSIFDSFQQAGDDTTARFGGTGLGLTIARELVQLHGSDINVESGVGKGSTFSFTLALPLADAADLEQTGRMGSDLYFTQKLKILLADDNAFNREIAREALLRHFENVEIVEAVDGMNAVELLAQQDFDLILMDMQMPEMTGAEATQHIRQHFPEGKRDVPIIAITASATPEEIEKALESGMNRHLAKPFKPMELAKVIAEVLGLSIGKDFPSFKNLESLSESPTPSRKIGTGYPPSLTPKHDLAYLRDFCDGDEAQVQYFIQKFEAQCTMEIERLEEAFEKQDREAIYQAVHSFKPQLEFVGLKAAALVLANIEQAIHEEQSLEALARLFKRFKEFV